MTAMKHWFVETFHHKVPYEPASLSHTLFTMSRFWLTEVIKIVRDEAADSYATATAGLYRNFFYNETVFISKL